MIENAAVFINHQRKVKNVNVAEVDGEILVTNRVSGDVMFRYSVAQVAKEGMAWDVTDESGKLARLVAQQGCGCSGMKPYANDPSYTGGFNAKR